MLTRRFVKQGTRPVYLLARIYGCHHLPRQTRWISSDRGDDSDAKKDSIKSSPVRIWGSIAVLGILAGFVYRKAAYHEDNRKEDKAVPNLDQLCPSGGEDKISYGPIPTSEDVTRQLNETTWSYPKTGSSAVHRYDGAQLGSNSPCEDAYLHGRLANPIRGSRSTDEWMAWAVFDGHCGWQMSDLLTRELVPAVRRALNGFSALPSLTSKEFEEIIHRALKSAFTGLDDRLVKTAAATIESADLSFPEKARRLEAAYAGACALLALFDPHTRTLRVASTGDCRAVLGRRIPGNGRWEARELTTDQTGANADEAARIRAAFPDEPGIVAGGRVWGMQPSRTFGDGMWKWSAQLKKTLRDYYNGLSLPSATRYKDYKEGPYLTAEPAVTTVEVPENEDSFLILATDGLWDTMSSEDAVNLVGWWIEWQRKGGQTPPPKPWTSGSKKEAGTGPTVLGWERNCQFEEANATVQDGNAAVHLVRNGLGGADDETVRGALTFRYPNSRDIRDDITVQVVFFNSPFGGDGKGGGK